MIRFKCHQCGKKFKAPEELAGRHISCSACGTQLTIPMPAEILAEPPQKKEEKHEAFEFDMPKRPVYEDLVDMTAMVDIVFFLLIFFMITSMQGLYSAIGIPAPSAEKTTSQAKRTATDYENDSEYAVVRIDRDNMIWLDGDKIPSEQELSTKLRAARQGGKNGPGLKKLMILGNGDCNTVTVVKVIDAGNDAGMEEVQLAIDDNE
jgi:biopolymer transport protein ExbD